MPTTDIEDNFGRQVIALDGSHEDVVDSVVLFVASAPNVSLPAEALATFCYPLLQIVGRS